MAPVYWFLVFIGVWWLPLMLVGADEQQGEGCSRSANRCGTLTISDPFWLAETDAGRSCGILDFKVTCYNNSSATLRSSVPLIPGFAINSISYEERNLRVVDEGKQKLLEASSGCGIKIGNTSAKLDTQFKIDLSNLNLILYNCTEESAVAAARPDRGLVQTRVRCRNEWVVFVRSGVHHDRIGNYASYAMEGCDASVVPVLGSSSGKTNASDYEQLIKDGFLLTWEAPPLPLPAAAHGRRSKKLILIVSLSATISLLTCLVWGVHRHKKKISLLILPKQTGNKSSMEEMLRKYGSLAPKRYKYSELKQMTSSFKDKLGEGGYGMVFRGSLQDGCAVAVKLLKVSKGNGEEFLNEAISICRTSHINIVCLLGFCLEGAKRALVYEYMANGSLEKYIYTENSDLVIGWDKLQQIALGIARGLEYLHQGCSTRIIHFDIKPQNILLDEDFCPKIADFGLAKLCHLKAGSILSVAEARGTIGFIAPEVFSRGFGVVSTKSDVYSYGMMLMEMVGGRINKGKGNTESSSDVYFPNRIYDSVAEQVQTCEVICDLEEAMRKMALVGLWCIQTNPENRPSMSKVIDMLEKSINELEMPPKPFLSCPSVPSYLSPHTSYGYISSYCSASPALLP
ncbi:hypothetical protein CFC21_045599 [Triticum aestivum]|uniref:Protein kinase domain-containing protein n=4 Tax=Triticinae TaxID=1648030 RepID=A0A453DUR7_AEGTS|nr:LEAF RUST 10 DISEASE-RESISTANCE LOCUS RECEPTOR-LIKE PROTEIN KINASE-like 2.4 [Triticum aestivum]KAF7034614.1 hypothetical protein CFC21_045599 [Triticum aestivum]